MADETVVTEADVIKEYYTFPNEPVLSRELRWLKKFWAACHRSIVVAMIFTVLGIGIGIKVSKDYYVDKMDEVTKTGAFLFKSKVYNITLKL